MKVWQCSVCKYIHKGETPPEKCPVCGVDSSKFIEIDPESIEKKETGTTARKTAEPKEKAASKAGGSEKSAAPKKQPPPKETTKLQSRLEKIKALLIQHHAHPVSVHMPNGILPAAVILFIIGWLFSAQLPGKAGVINLVFVVLALPVVIYTGLLEWKKKYNGALTKIFQIKIAAAAVTATTCVLNLLWFLINPDVLTSSGGWLFILLNIIMLAAAGIAGHMGGKLVFKD